ncbi:hypothetical protein D3C78_918980 [compost metagenome]
MVFEHVAHRHIAPAVGAGPIVVHVIGVAEDGRQGIGAGLGRLDRLGVVVAKGQILGQTFYPPDGGLADGTGEVAGHVETAIQIVHIFVLQIPHREQGAQPGGLVGDETCLVAGLVGITFQIHAAVVGGDAVDEASVAAVVGVVVEHHHLQRVVDVARQWPVLGLQHAVEVLLLVGQGCAALGQLLLCHILGSDAQCRPALVADRQHDVGQPLLEVTGAVLGAMGIVIVFHGTGGR